MANLIFIAIQRRVLALVVASGVVWGLSGCGGNTPGVASSASEVTAAAISVAPVTEQGAARFLWKAGFGPTESAIAQVRSLGYAGYVDQQLAVPAGRYNSYMSTPFGYPFGQNAVDAYCAEFPTETLSVCRNWLSAHGTPSTLFFKSAVHDADQLRLRVAFALSQILVVSMNTEARSGYGMRIYQQMLRDHAFGNYRDILLRVSKNPYMGKWLDMVLNNKTAPNENYARELLQLFSVGIYEMNDDGTFKLDAQGNRIETYTDRDVQEFSRALTGWVYAKEGLFNNFSITNYGEDMQIEESRHDVGAKSLLNGGVLPPGQGAGQDLEGVIDNVFNHPNTGRYISRQLIQFLVTSNPSPAYVHRVVQVFNRNSQGVRGDMASVVRAILLDAEALNPPDNAGRLMEPAVALAGLVRVVGGETDGVQLDSAASSMNQRPFAAPSVFNFYSPEFALPLAGVDLQAPQFGIVNLSTAVNRLTAAQSLIYSSAIAASTAVPKGYATGTKLIWPSAWLVQAGSDPAGLVDVLNVRMAGGVLDVAQKSLIVARVQALPAATDAQRLERLRLATLLVFSSPQFMAHR